LIDRVEEIAHASDMKIVRAIAYPEDMTLRPFGFIVDLLNQSEGYLSTWRDQLRDLMLQIPSVAEEIFPDTPTHLSENPGQVRSEFLARIFRLVREASNDQPMLISLDNAHFADSASMQFLELLAGRNDQHRIIVLAVYNRTDEDKNHTVSVIDGLRHLSHVRSLSVGPLSVAATRAVIEVRFPRNNFTPGMIRLVHQNTKGHPLSVIQYIENWRDTRLLREVGGTWMITDLDKMVSDPINAREMISERLRRLGRSDRELLGHASVQGQVFLTRFLSHTLGEPSQRVVNALARLRDAPGVFDSIKRGAFRFVHPLILDLCTRLLPEAQCKYIHSQLAEKLLAVSANPALVAHHLYLAEDYE
jgi:predicted ATPase